MARPERNNVDYFPFYCDEGKKMFYIEERYGNDGFATFVKILRELAKSDYHYLNLSDKTTLMFLSAKCKVDVSTLENIINDLVELEKFDSKLWANKIIWCQSFVDSIEDAYIKRKNKCITYQGLLLHLQGIGILKRNKLQLKGVDKPQSKVEYSKVDKNIPLYEEFKSYTIEKRKDVDVDLLALKYEAWVEAGWKDGHGKKIKNWKSKLLQTLPYLLKNGTERKNADTGGKKDFTDYVKR